MGLNMVNRNSEVTINRANSKLLVNYFNQSLGDFEPFLEPWTFEFHSKSTKKLDIEFSKTKIVSVNQISDRMGSDSYRNGLNVNLTI